ncbi:hypothetical protein [Streptococcus acidominimus]|uniref:hypothetical protein n=1 Tax=Streptococcus acidominimus TaxID=1326 RepID=UPI000AF32E5B|nr:hypothetical protein [Streptococcus acidominimus]
MLELHDAKSVTDEVKVGACRRVLEELKKGYLFHWDFGPRLNDDTKPVMNTRFIGRAHL